MCCQTCTTTRSSPTSSTLRGMPSLHQPSMPVARKHTAVYCTALAKEAITTVENDYWCIMKSVVTDNAKNMEVMRNNLCEANHTLSVYGCSVLLLILLGKYITPPAIMVQVVNKYFRIHHDPGAFLSAIYLDQSSENCPLTFRDIVRWQPLRPS